jgi:hypothetical protein
MMYLHGLEMSTSSEAILEESDDRTQDEEYSLHRSERETSKKVTVHCFFEISEQDLAKMTDKLQEFQEAKRDIEASIRHLNYKTRCLEPGWEGWRLKSFVVEAPSEN